MLRARASPGGAVRRSASGWCVSSIAEEAIVGVLVDDDQPEPAVRLGIERVEEAVELGDATERRHDQVERREAGRHAP